MSIAEKLTAIAENEHRVYDAGKRAQYNAFWDAFQKKGSRTVYSYAFAEDHWTRETFKPKYDIVPIGGYGNNLFANSRIGGDLTEILKKCGVRLDLSQATNLSYAFTFTDFTKLGVIDISKAVYTYSLFASSLALEEIEKLICSPTTVFSGIFSDTRTIKKLTVEGTIGQNGFDIALCSQLSRESIESIVNALSDSTRDLTVTLSQAAVEAAFGGAEADEWLALTGTKPNWTINLM